MALLFHILPGYIDSPTASSAYKDLISYIRTTTPVRLNCPLPIWPSSGLWLSRDQYSVGSYTSKWIVSLLKAWYGDAATEDNDFAYHYIPKRDPNKNYSHIAMFEAMHKGEIDGLFINGSNPLSAA